MFDNRSLVVRKRSVRIGKRGSCFGSYIVVLTTRIGQSAKLGVGGRECSAVWYSGRGIFVGTGVGIKTSKLKGMRFERQMRVLKLSQGQM